MVFDPVVLSPVSSPVLGPARAGAPAPVGKSEAPRAALPAEAGAPLGATPRSGMIHLRSICRCYPSSRPKSSPVSASAGGRSRFADSLAGCPVRSSAAPILSPRLPGSTAPMCSFCCPGFPARIPRSDVTPRQPFGLRSASTALAVSPEGSSARNGSFPSPDPLPPREPGWPSARCCCHC